MEYIQLQKFRSRVASKLSTSSDNARTITKCTKLLPWSQAQKQASVVGTEVPEGLKLARLDVPHCPGTRVLLGVTWEIPAAY